MHHHASISGLRLIKIEPTIARTKMNMDIVDTSEDRTFIIQDELVAVKVLKFEQKLNDFIRDDHRDIVIDLMHITKIDSMSIAAIIRIKNKLSDEGRNLKLINPNEGVMRVLELAGLESYLLG